MSLGSEWHQKPVNSTGRAGSSQGEARCAPARDESQLARHEQTHCGPEDLAWTGSGKAEHGDGVETRQSQQGECRRRWAHGSADGGYLKLHWKAIRQSLLLGTYRPSPVRRVQIPKPGGGLRELGIPTVVDRLIQQALLQVLQPVIDPTFSGHSFGFRPGRSPHGQYCWRTAMLSRVARWWWMWTWRSSSTASTMTS